MEHDGRAQRGPRDRFAGRPVEERAEALKERVYATFTGLAIVLVQAGNVEHLTARQATLALLVGIVGITVAGFVADIVSHLAVHAAFPSPAELGRMARVAGEALASAGVPLILLALAWLGVFELAGALRAASIVYIVTLALIGFLAVRRTHLEWWKQVLALAMLVGLGLAVIGLQQLAHAH
ncbi:energy-converting hydrogenase Eha subunit H [Agromyces sp. 3263]|uniref:hypothetical protein n=1 Tax=Agromyces sp. 3263 TaxID=2817750 RepID=UPI002857EC37|nr:hypothetical protein [Agromyces sp. 3263]MDR6905549.1 energy-converting hydrogenase Eha subunit H [Agromyces sp. 3263]